MSLLKTKNRVLLNSTDKSRGVIVGSMGTTNQHRTWGRKPRLAGEQWGDSNRWQNDEPDKESGQMNTGIWSAVVVSKERARILISHFPRVTAGSTSL
ncbi:hypothetical protein TNCV_1453831 [Trichonephila clavipes]|nr:hypothetical protein TNCV_1453831 [Trichonephila clavipes]